MVKKFITGVLDLLLLSLVILIAYFSLRAAWLYFYKAAYPIKYADTVFEQSRATGVAPELLFAVIRSESGFNPMAQSSIPARGLMQITQDTFEWVRYRLDEEDDYDYGDMYDPETNIRYGAELIKLLEKDLKSDTNVLCGYHAGRTNALKWLDNPEYSQNGQIVNIPFGDTRRHVEKTIETKRIYGELYDFTAEQPERTVTANGKG